MPEDRRLVAIMITEVIGCTALMYSDEDKPLEILPKNQDIYNQLIGQYRGTLIIEMGNATLTNVTL